MYYSYDPIEILMVEDSLGDIRLTKEILKDAKIKNCLHEAHDGEEALKFLYKKGIYEQVPRPDLILLDWNLPKKNGYEVLKVIKSDPSLKLIPVVVLTTSAADEDILYAYELHANCYITKPVDLDQFIKVIRNIEEFWMAIVKLPKEE